MLFLKPPYHMIEGVALGYRWDMVLRGSRATPMGL